MDFTGTGLSLDISASQIIAGILFGIIGLYLFRYGKRDGHYPHIFAGLALMIYPYFVSGDKLVWVIGLAICGAAYYWR
jgi:hypothetical protein